MFAFKHSSNYFRVHLISVIIKNFNHDLVFRDTIAKVKQLIHNARKTLTDCIFQIVKNRQQKIEIEPWLKKISWLRYLKKLNRMRLMNLIKIFNVNEKPLKLVVWNVMKIMLRHSQQTTSENNRNPK